MKMEFEILADLIIHSFLRGIDYNEDSDLREGTSDIEKDEYHLFRPADKDGDWDYNDEA